MRLLLSLGLTVVVAFATPAIGQTSAMSRSDALISGFEQFDDVATLPEVLQLPSTWLVAFREMARRTKEANREFGTCLSVSTQSTAQRELETALLEYQKLLRTHQGSGATTAAFNVEEAQYRQRVDQILAAGTRTLEWIAGPIQTGQSESIRIAIGSQYCDSTNVGWAHSHPAYPAWPGLDTRSPSDADVINNLLSPLARLSVVVSENGICAMLVGTTRTVARREVVWPRLAGDFLGRALFPMGAGDAGFVSHYEQRVASFIAEHGGALYCGTHDGTLRRTPTLSRDDSTAAKASIMALKAAVLVSRWVYYPSWPEATFSWTDDQEPALYAYLVNLTDRQGATVWTAGTTAASLRAQGTAALLEELVKLLVSPDGDTPSLGPGGLLRAPDGRFVGKTYPRYDFQCPRIRNGWTCIIDAQLTESVHVILAAFEIGADSWWLVQPTADRRFQMTIEDRGRRTLFRGDAVFQGSRWIKQGKGIWDVSPTVRYEGDFVNDVPHGKGVRIAPEFRYEGEFANGRMHGSGRILKSGSATWINVRAVENAVMELQ